MAMSKIDELRELGVNIDEALDRFMGNSALYERMLGKLTAAVRDVQVLPAFEEGDHTKALENAHALKGVTGNLSITPLYKGYTEIVDELRAGNPDKARKILDDILPVQEKVIACIEKYQ
ncbi:MAG: hypothetical protein NC253_06795 [Ruminococcus sp.]|nr:hypothetical protein [Ruminococcus sp.]